MLPIVPGAIGDNPEPNPNDSHVRGFLRFMLKMTITRIQFNSLVINIIKNEIF